MSGRRIAEKLLGEKQPTCRQPIRALDRKNLYLAYIFLMMAITAEVIATSSLKASDGFSRPVPVILSLTCYAVAFYCLSQTLKTIPVGIAYGIWSGIGIILISIIGFVQFGQTLDVPAILGLALIVLGVVVVNLFSHSVPH